MKSVSHHLEKVQAILSFEGSKDHPQFGGDAIGKIGTSGFCLGLVGGVHLGMMIVICAWSLFKTRGSMSEVEGEGTMLFGGHKSDSTTVALLLQWSAYVTFLCFFHFAEFFITAVKQPKVLSYKSYLINHSMSYTLANITAWIEFIVESYFFGRSWKHNLYFALLGACILLVGQSVRSAAMWQCGQNFAHEIMTTRIEGHQLVTNGIYSKFRHPAYFGWFYWSIGTQILLCNPICTLAYACVSWQFFSKRIPYEEELLLRFYKEQYATYMRSSIIGIPLISSRGS